MSKVELISLENDCNTLVYAFRVWNDKRLYEYCTFLSMVSMGQSFLHAHRAVKLLRIICGKDNYTYRQIQNQGFCLKSAQFTYPFQSTSVPVSTVYNSLLSELVIQQENKTEIENIISKQLNGFKPEDRIIVVRSLCNFSEFNWPSHKLLESLIEEAPTYFEDMILSIVEELVNEKNDVEQLWLKPRHIKFITASVQSKKLFYFILNILSRITLFFILNSKQSFLLISTVKNFIMHVKNMCNNINSDFVLLFPRELQALVLLLETDQESYASYLKTLPSVKNLVHDKIKLHSLSCFAILIHFREWLFHLNNTNYI